MNKDFVDALSQVAHERGVTAEELISNFEEALRLAYLRQKGFRPKDVEEEGKGPIIEVHLDPQEGHLEVLEIRRVVEEVKDPDKEIDLETAKKYDPEVEVGEEMEFPVDPEEFSRIAVQIAKQVLTQRLKEAERTRVHNEYKDKEGEVVTGSVARVDNRGNVYVELGRGEALMPQKEQIPTERYHPGQRIKVYLKQVQRSSKGPSLVVSRAHEELLRYLLRQEVPEIAEGIVEVKAVAREPGSRSKVAVVSHNPNVDPIGACIGHKGQRIQAVSAELGRERIDIIQWSPNPKEFIRNALSPATVGEITIENSENGQNRASVVVAKDQHSLAIGKAGQNVRLASKLTGYEINFEEAEEITDLDAAILKAAERDESSRVSSDAKSRFESLFKDDE
ncbi:transcription termination factor NusA [Meiothermus ruber]|uniref:Transcription termination/antitermination protein NusA n=1 Tax=Meiothermus ruber (strain ATCC 35948 / DSM 1279 / VKM B-1258 / 21) TaxID=504728 RepID=D3PTA6_MEIRD|nr:transcription termination factor NusA [Meiothermus ruber]ADD28689.1 NusA antitermination factor [Meiothermus ruber DSM 1279]AGK05866.1 transcription elongation factor NusA [Meiothermus ruber DSM 1279]MCL6530986.1 transcription termination factor NusA [Meiothermus ruber]MCX7801822.1 transcription termination factor NusA [Meiothermus ruber]GAO75649.1 NusA antitermination factor [Meiothermus ruber H328]